MHETSAQGWCTGMTQRDGMGREVGGGFRMGNTCKSMADSCQYMAKTTAAAKSHQSCPTQCDPIDASPPGSCPWDSPGKNTGVGCHFLLQCMKVKSESEGAQSCPTLSDPTDCSLPGSSVHGISQARVLEWVAIAFSSKNHYNIVK